MKTAKFYLNQLPEPIRSQAIENHDNETESKPDEQGRPYDGMGDALSSFWWSLSPEGYGYWSDILDDAIEGKFDGPFSKELHEIWGLIDEIEEGLSNAKD